MEAVVSLLAGLPLQPEEGDGVELMEAKSQLFLKYVANIKESKHSALCNALMSFPYKKKNLKLSL